MDRQEVLKKAISVYGERKQVDKCVEECAELIQALMKERGKTGSREWWEAVNHVREEIADVQSTLDQMRLIFGDTAEQEAYKLERLEKRMEGADNGKVH